MKLRFLLALVVSTSAALSQKYDGPKPPKPDLPYLKHADTLLATEAVTAKTEKKKDEIIYIVEGANSLVKTPLAAPILLFETAKINPESLQLFQMESKNGRREVTVKPGSEPIRIELSKLGDTLSKIEPYNGLDPGEYVLVVSGSAQVFCFAVF